MSRDEIKHIVIESIREESTLAEGAGVAESMSARDVPGWDSLAHVRIMLGIEMELDIEVPSERTYRAETVGQLIDLVAATVNDRRN